MSNRVSLKQQNWEFHLSLRQYCFINVNIYIIQKKCISAEIMAVFMLETSTSVFNIQTINKIDTFNV